MSTSDVMVRASGPGLVTTTVNVNVPPGSTRLSGAADFCTAICGDVAGGVAWATLTVSLGAPQGLSAGALLVSPL